LDDGDLAAVPGGQLADLARRIEVEVLAQGLRFCPLHPSAQVAVPGEEIAHLEVAVEGDIPGHVANPTTEGQLGWLSTEHGHFSGRRAEKTKETSDGGRLPGPVGSEEPVYLALLHAEVERVDRS